MSLAKILLIGAALAAATPAFACDCVTSGWGGRYGVHRQVSSSSSYESASRSSSYQAAYQDEGYRGGGYRDDGYRGYHAYDGAYRHDEETSGSWSYRRVEERPLCRHLADRDLADHYGRRPLPVCAGEGELTLGGDFFTGDAGVGGFPDSYGGGGGGGGYVMAGGGAHAFAFAGASAHASVSVRFHGGFHGGHHGGGHHGGCGCGK